MIITKILNLILHGFKKSKIENLRDSKEKLFISHLNLASTSSDILFRAISTTGTFTHLSALYSTLEAFAIFLLAARFLTEAPSHVLALRLPYFWLNRQWIPLEHLVNRLFPLLFRVAVVMTTYTVTANAPNPRREAIAVELKALRLRAVAADLCWGTSFDR